MKHSKHDPRERTRITMSFDDAVRLALDTPSPTTGQLKAFIKTGRRPSQAKANSNAHHRKLVRTT